MSDFTRRMLTAPGLTREDIQDAIDAELKPFEDEHGRLSITVNTITADTITIYPTPECRL